MLKALKRALGVAHDQTHSVSAHERRQLQLAVAVLLHEARRADYDSLDDVSRAALDWFQTSVPERTSHNWQNSAAKLIAEDIRKAG